LAFGFIGTVAGEAAIGKAGSDVAGKSTGGAAARDGIAQSAGMNRGLPFCACHACENEPVDKYAVVIHQEPEGGFWAEVPALPGCYSQGETVDELMENVREAISGVLEVMKVNGTEPEPNIQVLDLAV
jgi:predicted RNase H-like HicB family nuclease